MKIVKYICITIVAVWTIGMLGNLLPADTAVEAPASATTTDPWTALERETAIATCNALDAGTTWDVIVPMAISNGIEPLGAALLFNLAVIEYCPEYADSLVRWSEANG